MSFFISVGIYLKSIFVLKFVELISIFILNRLNFSASIDSKPFLDATTNSTKFFNSSILCHLSKFLYYHHLK